MEREEGRELLEATRGDVAALLLKDDGEGELLELRQKTWLGWKERRPVPAFDAVIVELWAVKEAAVARAAKLRAVAVPYLPPRAGAKKRRVSEGGKPWGGGGGRQKAA